LHKTKADIQFVRLFIIKTELT